MASSVNRMWAWVFSAYVISVALEGPLRYGLALSGAGAALYIRDLMLLLAVIASTRTGNSGSRVRLATSQVLIFLLLLHSLYSVLVEVPPAAILFGLKIFLPLLAGVAFADLGITVRNVKNVYAVSAILALVGLGVQLAGTNYPWIGLSYDTGFGQVAAAKQWWTDEGVRYSGFSRASYNLAMMLALGAIFTISFFKNRAVAVVGFGFCMAGIYFSTTKGAAIGALLGAALLLIGAYRLTRSSLPWFFFLAMIGLFLFPLYVVEYGIAADVKRSFPRLLYSLLERFTWMWPTAYLHFDEWYKWLLGKGIGTIGTPHLLYSGLGQSYGDNFFVYQYSLFGALSLLYSIAFLLPIVTRHGTDHAERLFGLGVLGILFGYGLTANLIEEPFFALTLGLVVGVARKETRPCAYSGK